MKLICIFDRISMPHDLNINKGDRILTNNYALYQKYKQSADLLDIASVYISENLRNSILELASVLDEDYKDVLNDTYLKIFAPIYAICLYIVKLEDNIDTIVLFGGNENLFLGSMEAEGEGKKKFYSSAWLYNPIIYDVLNESYRIDWREKESFFYLNVVSIIREEKIRIRQLLYYLKESIRCRKYKSRKSKVLYFYTLNIQKNHLLKIANNIRNDDTYMIVSPHPTDKNEVQQISIGLIELMKTFFCVKKLVATDMFISILGKTINLENLITKRAFKTLLINYKLQERVIENNFVKYAEKNCTVVTNMTIGSDIVALNKMCNKHHFKHVNYQYTAMLPMLLPQLRLADEYYLYSRDTMESYSSFDNSYKFYFPKFQKPKVLKNESNYLRVGVFLQPDTYSKVYEDVIKSLLYNYERIKPNLKCEFIIKPHYRQDNIEKINGFIKQNNQFSICSNNINAHELIITCDVIISITSSVIFEALTYGVPAIILNKNEMYNKQIYKGGNLFPDVNIVACNETEVIDILNNFSYYYSRYYKAYIELENEINHE